MSQANADYLDNKEEISLAPHSMVALVKEKYDTAEYSELIALSQQHFTRQGDTIECPLAIESKQKINGCLNHDMCQYLINTYEQNESLLQGNTLAKYIISQVLGNEQIDKAAISYLQSEYMPIWYEVSKATHDDNAKTSSFKWHCDAGPEKHLKIIVYLNSATEHQGKTLVTDKATTDALKEIGYVFNERKYRVSDITPIVKRYNLPHKVNHFDLDCGDALIFNPFDVAHRGVAPAPSTPRYVFTLCLITSPMPWKQCMEDIYFPLYKYDDWANFMPLFRHYLQ